MSDGETELDARALGGVKPRQVLEILALHHGSPVSKARLADLLWPGRAPGENLATLESYVSVLRQRVGALGVPGPAVVRTTTAGYALCRDVVDVDLASFEGLVSRSQEEGRSAADRCALLRRAVAMAQEPLLADECDAEWAEEARRVHARRRVDVLVVAAEATIDAGDPLAAVEMADEALGLDPHRERAWAVKVAALDAAGLQADALRAYDMCREILAAELGCTPGRRLQDAFVSLLARTSEGDDELGDLVSALLHLRSVAAGEPVWPGRVASGRGPWSGGDATAHARRVLGDLVAAPAAVATRRRTAPREVVARSRATRLAGVG
nr:BTAD domain-containing putative transcriptional regulator [uncultured Actinotalea sp.]